MTREEAIKMLRGMKADNLNLNDLYTRDKYEALVMAIKALEQEPVLDKIRAEIAEYGSICVEYKLTLTDRRDKDIEQLVTDVLKQAKKQVLEIIDKYKAESEDQE